MPSVENSAVEEFVRLRPRLFGIAYRILGSAAEAEDIVQDAWLRWHGTDRAAVLEPAGFLTTITTRLAISRAGSARMRRETYIGPWLPEPVDTRADPHLGAERGEALELAILLLLEKLSPNERAAYVLREAFTYPYESIAEILQLSEANARQLVTRGRKHIADGRSNPVSRDEQQRLLEGFIAAAQRGDTAALEGLFAANVVSLADGGGAVTAARVPLVGRERVARVVTAFASHFWKGTSLQWLEVNGRPAVRILRDGGTVAVAAIDASAEGIHQILWMMNPAKLSALAAV
jgi:RNA polymerase sigma-70 factor (TIGR02957 family)